MASAELSRRVENVVGYPPLSEMSDEQRRELGRLCFIGGAVPRSMPTTGTVRR
jgi:hypothetical protein